MSNLVVLAFARRTRRALESLKELVSWNFFDVISTRQLFLVEIGPIEVTERLAVGNDPGLHRLYHEVHLFVRNRLRFSPIVLSPQLFGWCAIDGTVGIDE